MEGQPNDTHEVLPLQDYDRQVQAIQDEVFALQEAFEFTARKGMTSAKLHMLHDGLDAAQERLQELDEHTPDAVQSLRRRALVDHVNDMRMAYPLHEMAVAASAEIAQIRDLHLQVCTAYANAEHRLGLDDRRRFKGRIAQLAAQVQQFEHHHWLRLSRMTRAKKIAGEIADTVKLK